MLFMWIRRLTKKKKKIKFNINKLTTDWSQQQTRYIAPHTQIVCCRFYIVEYAIKTNIQSISILYIIPIHRFLTAHHHKYFVFLLPPINKFTREKKNVYIWRGESIGMMMMMGQGDGRVLLRAFCLLHMYIYIASKR